MTGYPRMNAERKRMKEHLIEKVGERLRDMIPSIKRNKIIDKDRN
jgi:ketol-acid reductoisomerase